MSKLLYVGQHVADNLKNCIVDHLDRYRDGDFLDLEASGDWRIPLSCHANIERLQELDPAGSAQSEINNSLMVGNVLHGLTPTLARENRLWVRLGHVECFSYSRARWLSNAMSDEKLQEAVRKHFFASTLTACRDDHAIARLWWNHYIAERVMPDDPIRALKVMLYRADIRLNFLERPGIAARPPLARGIVRLLENQAELRDGEALFRRFMKSVNLCGAGIAFEVWSDGRVDKFLESCAVAA